MSGIYRGPNGSATADALNIDGNKGDLTISNSGLEWTINPDVVDFSKIQNISTDVILGRASAGSGNIEEITCTAAGRALLDDANSSAQRTTLGLGNAATATIGTEVLAYDANLQSFVNTFTLPTTDATNGFVLSTNGSGTLSLTAPGGIPDGDKGDISVSTGGTVWTIDNDAVTYAKIQNVSATDKLLGRSTAGAGDIEEITCTSAGRDLLDDVDASAQRTTLGLGALALQGDGDKGDITVSGTGATWTIDNDAVSFAKMQNIATSRLLGRSTAGSGDVEELSLGGGLSLTGGVLASTLNSGTSVSATGTAIDFTGIPSWTKRIIIMFNGVSTNGTSFVTNRLGSASIQATGYAGATTNMSGGVATNALSTGFDLQASGANATRNGILTLTNINGNTWVASGGFALASSALSITVAGVVTLSGVLDRVRITTANGTDSFNAGSINILWE